MPPQAFLQYILIPRFSFLEKLKISRLHHMELNAEAVKI
jgi:hypothetical protein